jgi:hypothetical protein
MRVPQSYTRGWCAIGLCAVAQMHTSTPVPQPGDRHVPGSAHLGREPVTGIDVYRHISDAELAPGGYSTGTRQHAPSVQSDTIKAGVRQPRAREIAGLVQQGDREVRIAAADLSFTPRPNDQVVIGGKTYQVVSVNTRSPFSEAAILLCR